MLMCYCPASGGAAASNGFMVTAGSVTLGFSFTGATIPAGDGVLTTLTVSEDDVSDMCLSNLVLSGSGGVTLESQVVDCLTVATGGSDDDSTPTVSGCMDASACNHNADATEDDGSCEYAAENFDCDTIVLLILIAQVIVVDLLLQMNVRM